LNFTGKDPPSIEPSFDYVQFFRKIQQLKQIDPHNRLKTVFSIGASANVFEMGIGKLVSSFWPMVTKDFITANNFAKNLIQFATSLDFDGIDISLDETDINYEIINNLIAVQYMDTQLLNLEYSISIYYVKQAPPSEDSVRSLIDSRLWPHTTPRFYFIGPYQISYPVSSSLNHENLKSYSIAIKTYMQSKRIKTYPNNTSQFIYNAVS
jgi:hypothetical protein